MATIGWSSCSPMGRTGNTSVCHSPHHALWSDTEKAGYCHLSPHFIGQSSWPAAPAPPEGIASGK